MNKPPAFQFYVKDWRSSSTVRSMTREQRGDFIEMLAAAWDQDEPGTLPLPIELAAKICGISVRSFRKFLESFPKLWQIDGDQLVNPKLRAQRNELQQLKQKLSDAAKRTNEKRWGTSSPSDSGSDRSASTSATANTKAPLPPTSGGCGNLQVYHLKVHSETVLIEAPKNRRLWTDREKQTLHGARSDRYVEFFQSKGFSARVIEQTG